MIIDCISDTHGFYPQLDGGDLLIVAGDLTKRDELYEYERFHDWCLSQKYDKIIVIAGNHDNIIQKEPNILDSESLSFTYLCDSGTKVVEWPVIPKDAPEGAVFERRDFKIWGSPWTKTFPGINPHCKAFTVDTEEELAEKWALIPDDTDILITHGPPFTIRDRTSRGKQVGSTSLMAHHISRLRPKLWVFGHIHEGYGQDGEYRWNQTVYVNASHVNEYYQPVNKPIRIII